MPETMLCGVHLKNPVIAASGTFGFAAEYAQLFDVSRLGAVCTKGLTLRPRQGNSGVRVWETTGGILNSVGLQNPGIPAFLEQELPRMRTLGTVIIANVGGADQAEFVEGVRLLSDAEGVDIIELNISCPNVERGGATFSKTCESARAVVAAVRPVCHKPLMVKLSPDAEDTSRSPEPARKLEPTHCPWSTASAAWPSTSAHAGRSLTTSLPDLRAPASSPLRCAWCGRSRMRCTVRWSASEASARGRMPPSSCWPAPRPSGSGPRRS